MCDSVCPCMVITGILTDVMKSMPCSKTPALIICKRYLIENNLVDPNVTDFCCVGYTILQIGGEENNKFT